MVFLSLLGRSQRVFLLRRTDVRLTAKPLCGLDQDQKSSFLHRPYKIGYGFVLVKKCCSRFLI